MDFWVRGQHNDVVTSTKIDAPFVVQQFPRGVCIFDNPFLFMTDHGPLYVYEY